MGRFFWSNGTEKNLHPGRLTWTIIMEVWKIIFLSKWVICRFHDLPGCKGRRMGTKFFNPKKSARALYKGALKGSWWLVK